MGPHSEAPASLERLRRLRLDPYELGTIRLYLWAVAAIGLLWLFGPSGAVLAPPANLQALAKVDGTLTLVEDRRLELRPFRPLHGRSTVTLWIGYREARSFDAAHLRAHAAMAIPTRVYYRRAGGRYFAVWKEDAPANSQSSQASPWRKGRQ